MYVPKKSDTISIFCKYIDFYGKTVECIWKITLLFFEKMRVEALAKDLVVSVKLGAGQLAVFRIAGGVF